MAIFEAGEDSMGPISLIDEKYTHLFPNGELEIDYSPDLEYKLRVTPWADGMIWSVFKQGTWTSSKIDPNIPLLTAGSGDFVNPVIKKFLESVPEDIRLKLEPYRHLQSGLLILCAQFKEARDLAESNPNLLWLVAEHVKNRMDEQEYIKPLLAKKQKEILAKLYSRGTKSTVNILRYIRIEAGDYFELVLIDWFVARPEICQALRHFKKIGTSLLSVISSFPNIKEMSILQEYMKDDDHAELPSSEGEARIFARLWRDTHRLGTQLNIKSLDYVLKNIKNFKQLAKLHDEWITLFNAKMEEQHQSEIFPAPPLAGNENIIPILNSYDLFLEGKLMHHCVGSYSDEVLTGQSYIYKILKPERATLEIGLDAEKPYIAQLVLAANQQPHSDTFLEIEHWLLSRKG